jgi:hypothetical protein
LLVALALLIAVASVVASATRLKFALVPTALDPGVVERAVSSWKMDQGSTLERLEQALAGAQDPAWEKSLFFALRAPSDVRTALINERLTELDHSLQRWVRVPRVCASICTSSGFLLAATVLRVALTNPTEALEAGQVVDAAVFQAINVAAIGLAGAAFCISIQMRARTAAKSRAEAFDRLVQRLERLTEREGREETAGHTLGDRAASVTSA